MSTTTPRGKSVSKEQKLLLVSLLEEQIDLANDRFGGINGKETNMELWIEIAAKINSLGGANKDGDKWRRAWMDIKKYVRAQWTSLKEYDNRTSLGQEGSSRRPSQLTILDQRILDVIHKDACEGSGNIEGGIQLQSQEPSTSTSHPAISRAVNNQIGGTAVAAERLNTNETSRPIRSTRIRGSAYTRDKLLEEGNHIEKEKVTAFNRIAAAMEKWNEILQEILNNNFREREPNASPEYLETVFLE